MYRPLMTITAAAVAVLGAGAAAAHSLADRQELIAAGCKIQPFPNPTNKSVPLPSTIQCSPKAEARLIQAKLARNDVKEHAPTVVAPVRAD